MNNWEKIASITYNLTKNCEVILSRVKDEVMGKARAETEWFGRESELSLKDFYSDNVL